MRFDRFFVDSPAYQPVRDFEPLALDDEPDADAEPAPEPAAAAEAEARPDPAAALIERLWADGSLAEAFAPVIGPIEDAIAKAGSLAALQGELAGLLDSMDTDRFAELLARADFFGSH